MASDELEIVGTAQKTEEDQQKLNFRGLWRELVFPAGCYTCRVISTQ